MGGTRCGGVWRGRLRPLSDGSCTTYKMDGQHIKTGANVHIPDIEGLWVLGKQTIVVRESGWASTEKTAVLVMRGCRDCHGP